VAGRFRRWIVRPFAWGLAIFVVVVLGLVFFLRGQFLQDRARALIEARVGEFVGRPMSIERLRVSLLPLEVELWNVVVAGPRAADPPAAVFPHVTIEADWLGWRRPILTLRSIRLDAPRLNVLYGANGEDNMPRFRFRKRDPNAGPPRPPRLSVRLGEVVVRDGEFLLDDRRYPLNVTARDVVADALAIEDLKLRGKLSVAEVFVGLPRAQVVPVALDAEFDFSRGRVELRRVVARTPGLEAKFQGAVRWGATRDVELEFTASGSTDVLVAMGYVTDQLVGDLDLDGRFHWVPGEWTYEGGVRSQQQVVFERPIERLEGHYSGDRSTVRLDIDRAAYHGGSLSGSLRVDLSGKDYPTELQLEARGVDAVGLLRDQAIPIEAVAAGAAGTVLYRFPFAGAARGNGEIALELTPVSGEPMRVGLGGKLVLAIDRGTVRLPRCELRGAGHILGIEGTYDIGRAEGAYRIEVDTQRLEEIAWFLPAQPPGEPPQLWVPTGGRGRIEADLTLAPAGPSALVRWSATEVTSRGLTARAVEGQARIDERWVDALSLVAERPGARAAKVRIEGRIPLQPEAGGTIAGPLDVRVESTAWPLADARLWLPEDLIDLPVDGFFSGRIALRGDVETPSGELEGALDAAAWSDVLLGTLRVRTDFDPRSVRLARLDLEMPAGTVKTNGVLDLAREPGGFDLRIAGPALRLEEAPFANLWGGAVRGRLDLTGSVAGTTAVPAVLLEGGLRELAGAGGPIGDGRGSLSMRWQDRSAALALDLPGAATLEGGGPLDWRGAGKSEHLEADWRLALRVASLGAVAGAVSARPVEGFDGALAGQLRLAGALDALALSGEFDQVSVSWNGHSLANLEPVRFAFEQDALSLAGIYLGEAATANEAFLTGRIGLADEHRVDLRLQATLAASWLAPLLQDGSQIGGSIDALGTIRGTLANPEVSGQLALEHGSLLLPDFPHLFDDVRVLVLAYPKEWVLDEAFVRLGGGTLRGTGSVRLATPSEPASYRFQTLVKEVTLRYPEGWWLRGDGELTLQSNPAGRIVRGVLDLAQVAYVADVNVGFNQLMRGFFAKPRVEVADTDELFSSTQLNVALRAPGTFRVSNNLAKLRGSADLVLRGTLANPVIVGLVEVQPGGTLVYGDNDYVIEEARLNFANPFRMEPLIDLKARTRINPYDVTLNLVGTPERLNASFSSDPPIADIQILSLLAGGEVDAAADSVAQTATPGEAGTYDAQAFLMGQAASFVGQRVNTLFGFDRFRVAPLTNTSGDLSTIRVTVGKRLGKDLYATYTVDPSDTSSQLLQVEWRVASGLSLVFTQEGRGSYAVDARWETTF